MYLLDISEENISDGSSRTFAYTLDDIFPDEAAAEKRMFDMAKAFEDNADIYLTFTLKRLNLENMKVETVKRVDADDLTE